jgi:hypothetical protein
MFSQAQKANHEGLEDRKEASSLRASLQAAIRQWKQSFGAADNGSRF